MADCFITRRGGGGSGASKLPEFTYTGTYNLVDDGDGNWRIKFLTSGKLVFDKSPGGIDVFLCGGGAGGRGDGRYGQPGGGGGYTVTSKGFVPTKGSEYEIVIGAGGAINKDGGASKAFSLTANGGNVGTAYRESGNYSWAGNGGPGGSGGGGGSRKGNGADGGYDGGNGSAGNGYSDEEYRDYAGSGGEGQGTTTREFEEEEGEIYGCGGGAGGGEGGSGGKGYNGAANGASYGGSAGKATENKGGGGGGGAASNASAGGSGIVIIRNTRKAS